MDSETTSHADLQNSKQLLSTEEKDKTPKSKATEKIKSSIVLAQSEERVQALSVIMLFLCTGLQYAQGVGLQ